MASTTIKVRGRAFWARVFEENRDLEGFDGELKDQGGQYTVNVELDDDSIAELTAVKSQVPNYGKPMTDDEGDEITVYRLKRFHEKKDRNGNVLDWASGAPEVFHEDGKTKWDIGDDGWLGNGTFVEATVTVYEAGKVVGTRLESIRVIDHVKAPEREVA